MNSSGFYVRPWSKRHPVLRFLLDCLMSLFILAVILLALMIPC